MIEKMYYDKFTNEYCAIASADPYSPPERYLLTFRGDDIYIETYDRHGLRLSIAYTENDVQMGNVNNIRYSMAVQHKYDLYASMMIKWTIPAKKFDEYVERFDVK